VNLSPYQKVCSETISQEHYRKSVKEWFAKRIGKPREKTGQREVVEVDMDEQVFLDLHAYREKGARRNMVVEKAISVKLPLLCLQSRQALSQ